MKNHDQIIKQLYRKLGYFFAKKLELTSITPNQVTVVRLLFIIISSLCILSNNYFFQLIAAFLIILFSFFDALDGSLATIKKKYSILGTWLDPQIDRLGFLILFTCIAFYLSNLSEYYIYLTYYVLILYLYRSLIPSDIRFKDKFLPLRENGQKNNNERNTLKKKENNILYQIKLQSSPHTHNIILYLAFGLIFKIIYAIIIFLSIYLTMWYLWENFKIIKKSIKIDKN